MRLLRRRLVVWAGKKLGVVGALQFALRHPATPWYAKALGGLTLVYALSPVDLIPDVIPVIGYVDDLVVVPLGLWLAYSLIPKDVRQQCRLLARSK